MSQWGRSALLLACDNGHLDVVRWLVTDAGSDARSEQDDVSFRRSCRRLCVSLLRRERQRCVLASCSAQECRTALLLACAHGHFDVAWWLVTHAGSDARSERGKVSSRCCCGSFGCAGSDIASCLVSRCGQTGFTALLAACERGRLDAVRWLVTDAGSDARSERDNVSSCR